MKEIRCSHLAVLEEELQSARIKENQRGPTWGEDAGQFVYYDCIFDRESIRRRLTLAALVEDQEYLGTHMGSEYGFYCKECKYGVMGYHPKGSGKREIYG